MIVLGEKHEDVNVLHIIIGPETEFQFNLSGQSIMDISEYIANYKDGDKCVVVVNRCYSEEELIQELNFHRAKNQAMSMMSQFANQIKSSYPKPPVQNNQKKVNTNIACPKCGAPHSATIVNGHTYPCEICQKIDDGIQGGEIPPIPSKDELNKLKKNIENENLTQKKTMFKFYKSNSDKDNPDDKKGKK